MRAIAGGGSSPGPSAATSAGALLRAPSSPPVASSQRRNPDGVTGRKRRFGARTHVHSRRRRGGRRAGRAGRAEGGEAEGGGHGVNRRDVVARGLGHRSGLVERVEQPDRAAHREGGGGGEPDEGLVVAAPDLRGGGVAYSCSPGG